MNIIEICNGIKEWVLDKISGAVKPHAPIDLGTLIYEQGGATSVNIPDLEVGAIVPIKFNFEETAFEDPTQTVGGGSALGIIARFQDHVFLNIQGYSIFDPEGKSFQLSDMDPQGLPFFQNGRILISYYQGRISLGLTDV